MTEGKIVRILYIAVAILLLQLPIGAEASPMTEANRREVRIPAGDVELAATLYRPRDSTGALPAVVIAHGSAPSTRQMVSFYTNLGLRMGLAVLAFDKRGTGQSTGTYEPFSVENSARIFQDQASDVVHGFRWLIAQPGIDSARAGLLGGSQAGWIMPLAASQEPRIGFLVAGEGVPIKAAQEHVHGMYLTSVYGGIGGIVPWRHVRAADDLVDDYRGPSGFDPAPILEKLETPALWIFGLYDDNIPVISSIHRIGELQRAGRRNHFAHVLPFGDHNFNNVFTRERYDLVEAVLPWLREIGILPESKSR